MDEYIDILTKDQKFTGRSCLKSEIHQKGHYHNTAHVWLYTKTGHILLAQRSAKKIVCPLLWDVSVAGHVDAGETNEQAAVRETFEELGLTLSENSLEKIGVFECFQSYPNGIIDNEFHHTYMAELEVDINELTKNDEEVEALKLVSFDTFESLLNQSNTNHHFIASNSNYYKIVVHHIKNKLT
ncbi:MAG: NUDIX domain-containing protein [Gelidibacter sp.]